MMNMELYLVRHGSAGTAPRDELRRLTSEGRRDVERLARGLVRMKLVLAEIRHSGLLRAEETAEIVSAALRPARGVAECEGLEPEDDPATARQAAAALQESVMFVGHLPHLGRLASLLLVGNPSVGLVSFGTATAACLSRDPAGKWILKWVLTPETAGE